MKKRFLLVVMVLLTAWLLAGCGGGESPQATPTPSGNPEEGKTLYLGTCSACHGPDALGVTGLGKDLTTSAFVHDKSEEEMLAFLKTGRPASDPANTTGVDMPPKGGNPALTDENILDVIAYIRILQQ